MILFCPRCETTQPHVPADKGRLRCQECNRKHTPKRKSRWRLEKGTQRALAQAFLDDKSLSATKARTGVSATTIARAFDRTRQAIRIKMRIEGQQPRSISKGDRHLHFEGIRVVGSALFPDPKTIAGEYVSLKRGGCLAQKDLHGYAIAYHLMRQIQGFTEKELLMEILPMMWP